MEKQTFSPPSTKIDFVGLDTNRWSLEKGNLKIQQQVEDFIKGLQKENVASTEQ